MNLLQIRQKFITLSGRFDLATTDTDPYDEDNGADFFINAGMHFLERKDLVPKRSASFFDEVAVDSWYLTFQRCRAVQEVWVNDSEERWQLELIPHLKDAKEYWSGLRSATDSGDAQYYCPINLRTIDATDIDAQGAFFNYVKADDDGTYNGVLILPPTDVALVVEVIGVFYHTDLADNDDENVFTTLFPDMLLKAAFYQLETFHRNREGAKDWLEAITLDSSAISMDLAEEETTDMTEMEG